MITAKHTVFLDNIKVPDYYLPDNIQQMLKTYKEITGNLKELCGKANCNEVSKLYKDVLIQADNKITGKLENWYNQEGKQIQQRLLKQKLAISKAKLNLEQLTFNFK